MLKLIGAMYSAAVSGWQRKSAVNRAIADRAGLIGSYTNAERKRTRGGIATRRGTRDKHLDPTSLAKLGKEAADVLRNNPEGRAIIGRVADLVVQRGFDIAVSTGDPEVDTAYENYWRAWARSKAADSRRLLTHFQQAKALIVDAMVYGGAIVNPVTDGSVQIIPMERLCPTPMGGATNYQGGVELGDFDQPVAFWVRSGRLGDGRPVRLPAGASSDVARMFRCPRMLGADQTFGEPGIQGLIERLETLDSVIFNSALAYEIAAMMPLVVQTTAPNEVRDAMTAAGADAEQPDREDTNDPQEIEVQPGRAIFLPPGATAGQFKPEHPHTNFDKFVWTMVGLAGADLGIPLVLLSLDFSAVNFHGGKSAMGMAKAALDGWREELEAALVIPSYKQVIARGVKDGVLPFHPRWDSMKVVWAPMPIVDQKAEYEASAFGIEKNLTTLEQETLRLGTGQWEEIVAQRGEEQKRQREANVLPLGMPGAVDKNADAAGSTSNSSTTSDTAAAN